MSWLDQLLTIDQNSSEPVKDEKVAPSTEKPDAVPSDTPDPAAIDEVDFSYDGYQVVRGEFFAHINEPSISFSQSKLSVNSACIRRLPEVDYVQILINAEEKKLVLKASNEDAKDAFLWCRVSKGKRVPKALTCRVFFAKLLSLMNWNENNRYKILGKICRSGDDILVVFDLNSRETYLRKISENGKVSTSRRPQFPEEWKNQFGLPVEEHRKLMQVNIFNGYTVFGIKDPKKLEQVSSSEGGES